MSHKSTQRLVGTLLDVLKVHSNKFIRGNSKRGNARHVSPGGFLTLRRTTLPQYASFPIDTPYRTFINLAAPSARRRTEYAESRTLGYTPEQMFDVVSNVERYPHFVPWCKSSRIIRGQGGAVRAELEIGFPPVLERYTSVVTVVPNQQVRALCTDGSLFNHLETIWRFEPGPEDIPDSCKVHFYVSFELKSLLHSRLASLFFDEVVKQMVGAFESRAAMLFGHQQEATLRRRFT
ncbi:coenzyme Q-binding protein COQ10 homolog, mitochondrial isoform X2 [Hippocampus comes]|uniref:Si:ch73-141c7.1 n=1 Tax=Hippocampus comes TaxID=109280 RepID=A0A3Q2XML0_HIPCM|nr:PREDICTED: coenzyme Q-binding protein COQ10 homolog, mitochondrial-like isoform X1 [Hippocampus comes]XP_019722059.1 PREDICTED: coenzyme Q-binding protein COQ10 homolog, mitochondrial-like isoform X2 [Hippocampus comes]